VLATKLFDRLALDPSDFESTATLRAISSEHCEHPVKLRLGDQLQGPVILAQARCSLRPKIYLFQGHGLVAERLMMYNVKLLMSIRLSDSSATATDHGCTS
jgi:hypothetical protein